MSSTHITSVAHILIKQRRRLHEKKGRETQGLFMAEGIRTCNALVASTIVLQELFVTHALYQQAMLLAPEDQIIIVNDPVMKKLSTASTPSGMIGIFKIPETKTAENIGTGIVLAQISDPGNAGTLIRTCAALGIQSIIAVEGVDLWSPKVIQSSAGTIGRVDIFEWSWQQLTEYAGRHKILLAALVVEGGSPLVIEQQKTTDARLFVIGNEAHGIPEGWLRSCNEQITLPMPGKTESLNAAIAGSIVLYINYLNTNKITPHLPQ